MKLAARIMHVSFRTCNYYLLLTLLIISFSCIDKKSDFTYHLESIDKMRLPSPQYVIIPDSLLIKNQYPYLKSSSKGQLYPLQRSNAERWLFINDTISAESSETYTLIFKEEYALDIVSLSKNQGNLTVKVNNKEVLTYQMKTILPPAGSPAYYQRSGYIHPAYSPAGKIMTDGFPKGHMHQHGIFFAWVNTTFQGRETDFWNQQDETGTVIFDSLISTTDGPVFGEFIASQKAVALKGEDTTIVLDEKWKVRVYNVSDYFIWDIEVQQVNVSDDVLKILPYHYGGMAFRGSEEWNDTTAEAGAELTGPGQGGFLTSDGYGRKGNHTRPAWVSMFGDVEDAPVNLTVMGSSKNYRVPQYVRIHPTMPYFCFTPVVEYGFDFKPGDIYKASYRVISFDGKPEPSALNNLWIQYYSNDETITGQEPI